ncbi:MAG: DNA mismatch repair protein MutS [Flavobacterium sp.]|nr:DNA mismatch repair protein MutS [Pedobacter sp.]
MQEIIKTYHQQISVAVLEIKKLNRLINLYSLLRLAAILFGFTLVYQSLKFELIWLTELTFLFTIFLFGWLVSRQNGFEKRKTFLENTQMVFKNEIESIQSYHNMYPDGSEWQDDHHVYTSDLDIFGPASLFHFLNRCATHLGSTKLARWLKSPAEEKTIRLRQEALKEIATKNGWKERFQVHLFIANKPGNDHISGLLQYLHTPSATLSNNLRWYIKLSGWIFVPMLIGSYYLPIVLLGVLALGIFNLFILQITQSKTENAEIQISNVGKNLNAFEDSFKIIEDEIWKSALCCSLKNSLEDAGENKVSRQIEQLSAIINRINLGSVPLFGFILKVSVLWNLKQLISLENWKKNNLNSIDNAFNVIAEFEALISMATLNINHSEYHFPEILKDEKYTLTANCIGHPLIPLSTRVLNNFSLNNELKIDIITGSNMAGKSTFLRTLGINTVLALSGSAVCALQMKLTPMTVFTYMRIRDSLNENTSTFKAELDRLQLLLKVLSKEEKIYFLIDEMLRGTNSVDKYRGSKAVIEKLIAEKAVGILATHDLQIAHLEKKYPEYIRNFYFDILFKDQEMQFDYKLKTGECKTFNASLLLKQLGIIIEE